MLQKTSGHEELLDALSSRLAEAQLQLSESTQSARLAEATCESTRTRLDKTQQQLDSLRLESRGKIVALQVCHAARGAVIRFECWMSPPYM